VFEVVDVSIGATPDVDVDVGTGVGVGVGAGADVGVAVDDEDDVASVCPGVWSFGAWPIPDGLGVEVTFAVGVDVVNVVDVVIAIDVDVAGVDTADDDLLRGDRTFDSDADTGVLMLDEAEGVALEGVGTPLVCTKSGVAAGCTCGFNTLAPVVAETTVVDVSGCDLLEKHLVMRVSMSFCASSATPMPI
jgi:hypothetical protein